MKKPLLILAVSLIANVALLAVLRSRSAAPESSTVAAPAPAAAPASPTPDLSASVAATPGPSSTPSENSLIDPETRDLVARMRAMGIPEIYILSAAQLRLAVQYQARMAEVYGMSDVLPPFWDTDNTLTSILQDPERAAARQALSNEMQAAMRELFGPEYPYNNVSELTLLTMQQQYGNLPAEKIIQIQRIMSDYSQRMLEARGGIGISPLTMLPEQREAYNQLQAERDDAIRASMTKQEYREYELNSSSSANTLRNRLVAFNPSEQEFLALFEIQRAFDEEYPSSTLAMSIAERQARSQAQQELESQFLMVLSPERQEEYRLTTQGSGQTVARLVARLELPTSTIRDVLQVESVIQQQANALRQNGSLAPQARNQQLGALADQATGQLTELLGPDGFDAYQNYGGGWIQNLVPQAPVGRGGPTPTLGQ